MFARIAAVLAIAAMIFSIGCANKNLLGPEEVVKSEASMEAGNLEVSMPLPEWLKAKLAALPASKLAGGGDPGEGPLSIYIMISRTADGGVETQKFPLIPNMATGIASGVAQVDIGSVTLQAFYHEIGQGVVDFQSKPIALTIAPKKRYQVTFHMERVSDGNVSFSAIWDNTPEEVVVIDDATPTPTPTPTPTIGDVVVSIADDSPVGDVIRGATAVPLAKFSYTAHKEDILVSSVGITVNMVNADQGEYSMALQNVKIILDGAQVGTTQNQIVSSTTVTFNLNRTFIVASGRTRFITIVADITNNQLERDDTIAITLVPGNSALGLSSSSLLWAPQQAIAARTLTVSSGVISVVKNTAFGDRSASMPTGVPSARNVQIASFMITAGYEPSSVWQIVMKDPSSSIQLGDNFQNLRLLHNNTQISETIGSLDKSGTSTTYSFDTSIGLNPREQYVVNVFADILSSPQDPGAVLNPVVVVDAIGAVGVVTGYNTGLNSGQYITLQNGYISSYGSLVITTAADTPIDQVLVMGDLDKEVFKFKFAAGMEEDVLIDEINIGCETESLIPGGTLMTAKLYNGSTKLGEANWAKWTGPFSADYFVVGFRNLSILVPRNSSAKLTLKVDVGTNGDAISGFKARFVLYPDYDGELAGDQPSITAIGISSAIALTGDALKFQGIGGLGTVVISNEITVYATKISVAWASDTPSGSFAPSAGQVVAKFTVSNSDNPGHYSASIKHINTMVGISGSHAISRANLAIYKDVVSSTNLVSSIDGNFVFNEVSIASGASTTFIVTLDTNNLDLVPGQSVSVSIPSAGIIWQDGVGTGQITAAEGLPLSTKTLFY